MHRNHTSQKEAEIAKPTASVKLQATRFKVNDTLKVLDQSHTINEFASALKISFCTALLILRSLYYSNEYAKLNDKSALKYRLKHIFQHIKSLRDENPKWGETDNSELTFRDIRIDLEENWHLEKELEALGCPFSTRANCFGISSDQYKALLLNITPSPVESQESQTDIPEIFFTNGKWVKSPFGMVNQLSHVPVFDPRLFGVHETNRATSLENDKASQNHPKRTMNISDILN